MRELLGLINLPSSHRGPRMMWRRDVLWLSAEKSFQPYPRLGLCSIGENEANTLHRQRAPCSSRGNAIGSVTIEVLRRPRSHLSLLAARMQMRDTACRKHLLDP